MVQEHILSFPQKCPYYTIIYLVGLLSLRQPQ